MKTKRYLIALQDERCAANAANALGLLANPYTVEPLINATKSEDKWIRKNAAQALGRIKDSRAIDSLFILLLDEIGFVRVKAAEALDKFNESQWKDIIQGDDDLKNDFIGLAKTRDIRIIELMVSIFNSAKSVKVKGTIADALGYSGNCLAVEPLTT